MNLLFASMRRIKMCALVTGFQTCALPISGQWRLCHSAAVAAETTLSSADLLGLRRSLRTHATGGLLVWLALVALSIYKPRGMTRYGWCKQHERREVSQ